MSRSAERSLQIHPLTPERWDDLAELFTRRGPRGGTPVTDGCWCMFWRERTVDGPRNRRALRGIVCAGGEPGLLAYRDGVPVGWVSVGPREEFRQFWRSPTYRPVDSDETVFSIVCFYVHSDDKRGGIGSALLEAAVRYATERGARWVEAHGSEQPSDYMGWRPALERAGFTTVRLAGKRAVMRLEVSRAR